MNTTDNPIAAIEHFVGELRASVAPFADGMAGIVGAIERLDDPAARRVAAELTRPLVDELAAAVEAVAKPMRDAEQRLARLAKGE